MKKVSEKGAKNRENVMSVFLVLRIGERCRKKAFSGFWIVDEFENNNKSGNLSKLC